MKWLKDYKVLIILLLPFFKPLCFSSIWADSFVNVLINIYRVATSVVIAIIWIKSYRKLDSLIVLYLLYSAFSLVCVYVNNENVMHRLISVVSMLSLILLISMSFRVSKKAWIKAMFYIVISYTFIQLVFLVLFPNGFNNGTNESRIHFLGKDNEFSLFIVLAFMICMIYIKYFGKIFLSKVCMLCIVGMEAYLASGCGVTITIFILASLMFKKMITKMKIMTVFNAIIGGLIMNYLLLFVNIQSYFGLFIQNFLHKDLTLSSRTRIWDIAISIIVNNPIFGTGSSSVSVPGWEIQTYSHNTFLDIGVNFGAIGMLLFVLMLLYIAFYCRDRRMIKDEQYIIAISLFASFIFSLVEGAEYRPEFISIIVFTYYIAKYTFIDVPRGKTYEQ